MFIAHAIRLVKNWWNAAQRADEEVECQAQMHEEGVTIASSDGKSGMSCADELIPS
jgi:hypothetical protein